MENVTLSQILESGEAMETYAAGLCQEDLYKVYEESHDYLRAAVAGWIKVCNDSEINEIYEGLLTSASHYSPREVVNEQLDHALLLIKFGSGLRTLEA